MALWTQEDAFLATTTATESLPDPTTVANRTHYLINKGSVTAVWSSTGATPFQENGINVATISVLRGSTKHVQSDGTRWIVKPANASVPQTYSTLATTGAGGLVTVTFPIPFATPPIVTLGALAATEDVYDVHFHSVTTTACVIHARRAPSVTILGISIVSFPTNSVGEVIHVQAIQAGAFG